MFSGFEVIHIKLDGLGCSFQLSCLWVISIILLDGEDWKASDSGGREARLKAGKEGRAPGGRSLRVKTGSFCSGRGLGPHPFPPSPSLDSSFFMDACLFFSGQEVSWFFFFSLFFSGYFCCVIKDLANKKMLPCSCRSKIMTLKFLLFLLDLGRHLEIFIDVYTLHM